ncbi:hypothetical protein HJC23_007935 [Cyclotella cryptica]|uniref:Uncharacterized protein n=1 Tax=Cyclotella cryptica TaxID=29204 RepID=A0ABD3PB51_9STRA
MHHPTMHRMPPTMHRRRCIADDALLTMHRRRAAVMPSTLSTMLLLDINPGIDGASRVPKGGHNDVNTTAQHPNNPVYKPGTHQNYTALIHLNINGAMTLWTCHRTNA